MTIYASDTVFTESADIVLLKFVESMSTRVDRQDMEGCVIDRLRDDTILFIRTVSGAEYTVSMKHALSSTKDQKSTHQEMGQAVYDRWMHIQHT